MILVDLNKNKVTIIQRKGGRPKKDPKVDYSAQKARHDYEEETKAELLEDQGGNDGQL